MLRTAAALLVAGGVTTSATAQNPITRVSVDDTGTQGDGDSNYYHGRLSVSDDGRFVAFDSYATNLVPGDVNQNFDVFVYDRVLQKIACMSVDAAGVPGSSASYWSAISGDGRFVAFSSYSDDLVANDGNKQYDVFVRDRDPDGNGVFDEGNGVTTLVSVDSAGNSANGASLEPAISADGSIVAFTSMASNLVPNDANLISDVFVRDLAAGTTVCASVDPYGAMAIGDPTQSGSFGPSLSADGKLVAFTSNAWNLIPADLNFYPDVFVRELAAATTTRVSVNSYGREADGYSGGATISADGRMVVFSSYAPDLVSGDTNRVEDVFEHDRTTGATVRVSTTSTGGEGDRDSGDWGWWYEGTPSAISSDGRFTAFTGLATNLAPGDVNGTYDVFLHDSVAGTTTCVTFNAGGLVGDSFSRLPALPADGSIVGFVSGASNLVAGDTNVRVDTFVFDRSVIPPVAAWSNYGVGLAGTGGVPSLTSRSVPLLDTDVLIDVANSLGSWSIGFLFVGGGQGSRKVKGGELLLDPILFFQPFVLSPGGDVFTFHVPADIGLCGTSVFMQVVEVDPGAVKGFSFTPGLEFDFGR
jgi:hypothetical protein